MAAEPGYRFNQYRLLPAQRLLLCDGVPARLGGRAYDTLLALVERRERTVGKHELMDLIWPRLVVEENNLQVQVATLRKLLGHPAISTVPGRGYRFTLPVTCDGAEPALPTSAAPTTRPADARAGNLPERLPRLVGRADELRMLQTMMEQHALVTVAGAGGIGKTRLALGAAALARPADGVWWVELGGLNDPALVAAAVAQALGVATNGAPDVTQAVTAALRGRATLLVLDSAEHLLAGVAAFVGAVRDGAAGVKVLVTSQEVLRAADEHVFRPGPLALPVGDDLASANASGAVALFLARVHAADPHFELKADNLATVVDICRRLDGIPLAIELAAARVPLLGVEGLRDRLDERFSVLTAGARAVMRRHQTLRAALEWSHALLGADEQIVYRRLGVFAGGFTLEAAQGVAEAERIDAWDVLEHLGALVDKSLVVAEGDPVPRYRMLETTRLFALERLAEAGETDTLLRRHARHFVESAESDDADVSARGRGGAAYAQLDRERDNLLHALAWCDRDGDADAAAIGLRLAAALRYFWTSRGLMPLGTQAVMTALARAEAELPPDRHFCKALASASQLQLWTGHGDEALALAQRLHDTAVALDDPAALATGHALLGMLAHAGGRLEDAERHHRTALQLGEALQDTHRTSGAWLSLGRLAQARGRLDDAVQSCARGAAVARAAGQNYDLAIALLNASDFARERDDIEQAWSHLQEVVQMAPAIGSRMIEQFVLDVAAALCVHQGLWADVVRLHAALAAQRRATGLALRDEQQQDRQRDLVRARAALGDADFDAAWTSGHGGDDSTWTWLSERRAAGRANVAS